MENKKKSGEESFMSVFFGVVLLLLTLLFIGITKDFHGGSVHWEMGIIIIAILGAGVHIFYSWNKKINIKNKF